MTSKLAFLKWDLGHMMDSRFGLFSGFMINNEAAH